MNIHIFPTVPASYSKLSKVTWDTEKLSDGPRPVASEMERTESLQGALSSCPAALTLREGQAACQDSITPPEGVRLPEQRESRP